MPNTLMVYPSDFTEPVSLLYKHVSGDTTVSRNTAIHAAYQVAGVGLGRFVPDPDSGSPSGVGSGPDTVTCDDDTCCCDEVKEKDGILALKKCYEELGCNDDSKGQPAKGSGAPKPVKGILDSALMKKVLAFAMQKLTEWLMK